MTPKEALERFEKHQQTFEDARWKWERSRKKNKGEKPDQLLDIRYLEYNDFWNSLRHFPDSVKFLFAFREDEPVGALKFRIREPGSDDWRVKQGLPPLKRVFEGHFISVRYKKQGIGSALYQRLIDLLRVGDLLVIGDSRYSYSDEGLPFSISLLKKLSGVHIVEDGEKFTDYDPTKKNIAAHIGKTELVGKIVARWHAKRVSTRYASGSTWAESAAVSLLQDAPEFSFDELLLRMVRKVRTLHDPVSRREVSAEDVEKALLRLRPEPVPGGMTVYHDTKKSFVAQVGDQVFWTKVEQAFPDIPKSLYLKSFMFEVEKIVREKALISTSLWLPEEKELKKFKFWALLKDLYQTHSQTHPYRSASGITLYSADYEKALRDFFEESTRGYVEHRLRLKPPDIHRLKPLIEKIVGKLPPGDVKDKVWLREVDDMVHDAYKAESDYDKKDEIFKVYRKLIDYQTVLSEMPDLKMELSKAERDASKVIEATGKNLQAFSQEVQQATKRIPHWQGSPIRISLSFPDWNNLYTNVEAAFKPIDNYQVQVGREASFTVFTEGAGFQIEDVLEAGDEEFFRNPEETSDYFNLVRELRKPGSSSRGRDLTLYTARPVKDRHLYEHATSIPSNIFLTNDVERAIGLAQEGELGGKRDVWRVVVNEVHLVKTLDTGRVKDYQVVGKEKVVIRDIELEVSR